MAENNINNSLAGKLLAVQAALKAPKGRSGYGYNYRSADDILEAVKPLLAKAGITLALSDRVEQIGDRYYLHSIATLYGEGAFLSASGWAVEPDKLASMAPPQITGTASSYARKRALEGLFLLDNEKDVDSKDVQDAIRNSRKGGTQKRQEAAPAKKQASPANSGGDGMHKARHRLAVVMAQNKISPEEARELCQKRFGKTSAAELSLDEVKKFSESLPEWAAESMA